jgi:signal transduction histidine kinase
MKISAKLTLAVFVPVLVALVVCVALAFTYRSMEVAHENGDAVRQVRSRISELNHLFFSYASYREERTKEQFLAESDSLATLIASIRLQDEEERSLLEDIRLSTQAMKDPFLKLVPMTDPPGPSGSEALSKEVEERLVKQLVTQSHRADRSASRLRSLVDDKIYSTQERTTALIFFVVILATGLLTFVLVRTRRRIITSLAKLHKGTEVVRSGQLDYTIMVERDDEIGQLSHAFNQMTASLREVTVSKSDLEREMAERERAEEALRKAHDELEMRVEERTAALAKANEALRELSARLLSAQEDERKRIASDLHDSIGGCLTGVKFRLESALQEISQSPQTALGSLNSMLPMVHEAVEECRRIQMDLRPSMIDDLGLLPTLSWFCRIFNQTYPGIRVEQKIDIAEGDIPEPLKIVIYRVTQEAMNNVAKHSKANLVRFSLRKLDDGLELGLYDNGRGFSLDENLSQRNAGKGLGLTSMKERAELSGGVLHIESAQGEGTNTRASWPLCRTR